MNVTQIECPHCGHKWKPSQHLVQYWIRSGLSRLTPELCAECEECYQIEAALSVSFNSTKLPERP